LEGCGTAFLPFSAMGRGKAWTTQEDNALRQLVTALTPSIKHLRDVGEDHHPGSRAILTGIQDICQEEGHALEQHINLVAMSNLTANLTAK